jgi:hypothetical protein
MRNRDAIDDGMKCCVTTEKIQFAAGSHSQMGEEGGEGGQPQRDQNKRAEI